MKIALAMALLATPTTTLAQQPAPAAKVQWEMKSAQPWSGRCGGTGPHKNDTCDGHVVYFQGPRYPATGYPAIKVCYVASPRGGGPLVRACADVN